MTTSEACSFDDLVGRHAQPPVGRGHVFRRGLIAADPCEASRSALAVVQNFRDAIGFRIICGDLAQEVILDAGLKPDLEARTALAVETQRLIEALGPELAARWDDGEDWVDPDTGVHRWDAALVALLRTVGKKGAEHADGVQAAAKQRAEWLATRDERLRLDSYPPSASGLFKLWINLSIEKIGELLRPAWLRLVMDAAWHDVVAAPVKLAKRRRPALVREVAAHRLLPLMTQSTAFVHALDETTLRDEVGRVVGHVALTEAATLEVVRDGAAALGSVCGNRLIRALVHRSHDAWNRGDQDPRRVVFERGWEGLAAAIGVGEKYQPQLKQITQAGQHIVWQTPHVKGGGLWTFSERRGSRARGAEVAFVLGEALSPGYGSELGREGGHSLAARGARRLVPELRFEPPMGPTRENEHGAIWTLHRLMLLELVDNAEDLYRRGAVAIAPSRWDELAEQARLTRRVLGRVLGAWQAGESERAPALLARSGDEWTLADPHEPERDFIADGGAKRSHGRTRATDPKAPRRQRSRSR